MLMSSLWRNSFPDLLWLSLSLVATIFVTLPIVQRQNSKDASVSKRLGIPAIRWLFPPWGSGSLPFFRMAQIIIFLALRKQSHKQQKQQLWQFSLENPSLTIFGKTLFRKWKWDKIVSHSELLCFNVPKKYVSHS